MDTVKFGKDELFEKLIRKTKKVDIGKAAAEIITGKTVLITGGGGTIGSEIARQAAGYCPKLLIIFDIYENTAYELWQELCFKYPELELKVLIGSVCDEKRMRCVFSEYRPDTVFHAAAHKHVPLMEDSPNEAVKNNVMGTYTAAYMAAEYGCERFILISTDKAAKPAGVMGASKRICEGIVCSFSEGIRNGITMPFCGEKIKDVKTVFSAVRFGNVFMSSGSLIPLIMKQIERGGPVTVTDKDASRYFMTVTEAVSLVMCAGAFAEDGQIFALDMGEPVNIDELVRKMIFEYGLEPGKDIEIIYTGLRKGEKLTEEKITGKYAFPGIFALKTAKPDSRAFFREVEELSELALDEYSDISGKILGIAGGLQGG